MEKYLQYFNEYVTEDQNDVLTICESASKIIKDRFKCKLDKPELVAAIYSNIYYSILTQLATFEKEYNDFQINICDRLLIGYSTTEDEDDEKQGNFQIYIRHLNSTKKNDDIAEQEATSDERAVIWNATNIKDQPKLLREIAIKAKEDLEKIDVVISSSELIFPIFVSIYEALIVYLTTKRRETDEFQYEINFCSCFNIGARESEEDLDEIYIVPSIASKLTLKNDAQATAKYEN